MGECCKSCESGGTCDSDKGKANHTGNDRKYSSVLDSAMVKSSEKKVIRKRDLMFEQKKNLST